MPNAERSRGWCFTLNNPLPEDEAKIHALCVLPHCTYVITGQEVGANGTPHLQGYVQCVNARTLAGIKGLLGPRVHAEIRRGTIDQAVTYCKKDGVYKETGTPPKTNKEKGIMERDRWARILENSKKARFDLIEGEEPQVYMRYYRTIQNIAKDHMPDMDDLDEPSAYWYYGAPGTGKSHTARERFPNAYLKNANKWWDGYQGEDYVIIDEIEKDAKYLGHFLKLWGDRYCFIAEIKGGAKKIRPKTIVVTSNYSIEEIFYEDPMLAKAISRRFRSIHFSSVYAL